MKIFKIIINGIWFILSVIYLWVWGLLLITKIINYEPYQLALALQALAIYLGDKIDDLKSK